MRILHENPEFHGAKLRFLQFLCIAKRVIVYSMPLLGMVCTVTLFSGAEYIKKKRLCHARFQYVFSRYY